MAFQGIALFSLGVFGLASLLYYIYTYNEVQPRQTYGSGNSTNSNDHNEQRILIERSWNPQSNKQPKRRRKSKQKSRIDDECTVCLLDVKDHAITLPCNHQFHINCIENWKSQGPVVTRNTCPNCRKLYN